MTDIDKGLQEALLRKFPQLKNRTIWLDRPFFKRMNDIEFSIFHRMPDIFVKVSEATMEYIEARRIILKLPKMPISKERTKPIRKK